jgi:methionine--tRNA ligase beta chain
MVTYDDFKKLELRIGEIVEADIVAGSSNLMKIIVDIGAERRQIVAGIAKYYSASDLIGKQIVVLINLEPKTIRGIESNGMLLAAVENEDNIALLTTEKRVAPGSIVE